MGSYNAEHFFANFVTHDISENVYIAAKKDYIYWSSKGNPEELRYKLNGLSAIKLNKKRNVSIYKKGSTSNSFFSKEHIINEAKKRFNHDIIVYVQGKLINENSFVFQQTIDKNKKTGKRIKIHNFTGFSKEFINLTEGSEHLSILYANFGNLVLPSNWEKQYDLLKDIK